MLGFLLKWFKPQAREVSPHSAIVERRHIDEIVAAHDSYPTSKLIAGVVANHIYYPGGSLVGFMPPGEDAMSLYLSHLRDPLADALEARIVSWLDFRGLSLQFAMGTNSGYWILPSTTSFPGSELSVLGRGKNGTHKLSPGTDWLLRLREPLNGRLLPLLQTHFDPDRLVTRREKVSATPESSTSLADHVDGRVCQWKSQHLAPGSPLSRPIEKCIDPKTFMWRE